MKDKYLPIGTIVILNDSNQKIMITGYFCNDERKKSYEYSGVSYPEGIVESNKGYLFNHKSIKNIIYLGLNDEESKEYLSKITSISKIYTDIMFNASSRVFLTELDGETNG